MKRLLVIMMSVCAFFGAGAQESASPDSVVYLSCDVMPEFPGGIAAMMRHIGENLQYPEVALDNCTQGKCVLQFVVTETGDVGEVKVLRSVSPECDAEATRVVRTLKFTPGTMDGAPVNVWYTLPVTFKLEAAPAPPQEVADSVQVGVNEKMPEFPGGEGALMNYIATHLRPSNEAIETAKGNRCVVQFLVTKTGDIGDVRVLLSVSPLFDREVIRMIRTLPKFTPGMMNGVTVEAWYTLPITIMMPPDHRYTAPDPTKPRNIDPGFSR